MFCPRWVASAARRFPLAQSCALALALLAPGCASQVAPSRVAGPQPPRIAKVEIEDDGLPAQVAPRNRRAGPDDPNEPWSPNYGRGVAAPVPGRAAAEPVKQLPPTTPAAALAEAARRGNAANGRITDARATAAGAAPANLGAGSRPTAFPVYPTPGQVTGIDTDTLYRRAIADHEMRRN